MTTKSPDGTILSSSDWSRFVWKPGDLVSTSKRNDEDAPTLSGQADDE
jgi:hypothetical protein